MWSVANFRFWVNIFGRGEEVMGVRTTENLSVIEEFDCFIINYFKIGIGEYMNITFELWIAVEVWHLFSGPIPPFIFVIGLIQSYMLWGLVNLVCSWNQILMVFLRVLSWTPAYAFHPNIGHHRIPRTHSRNHRIYSFSYHLGQYAPQNNQKVYDIIKITFSLLYRILLHS